MRRYQAHTIGLWTRAATATLGCMQWRRSCTALPNLHGGGKKCKVFPEWCISIIKAVARPPQMSISEVWLRSRCPSYVQVARNTNFCQMSISDTITQMSIRGGEAQSSYCPVLGASLWMCERHLAILYKKRDVSITDVEFPSFFGSMCIQMESRGVTWNKNDKSISTFGPNCVSAQCIFRHRYTTECHIWENQKSGGILFLWVIVWEPPVFSKHGFGFGIWKFLVTRKEFSNNLL